MVPFGPRLLLRTSWSPRAALMLTARAAWALATSALGFSAFTADMAKQHNQRGKRKKNRWKQFALHENSSEKEAPSRSLHTCSRDTFNEQVYARKFRFIGSRLNRLWCSYGDCRMYLLKLLVMSVFYHFDSITFKTEEFNLFFDISSSQWKSNLDD